jgi:RNA polymerase sigma factor (sigma-70 family)
MESRNSMSMSKEQAEGILKGSLKYIKKAITKKISIYEPLTLETTYGEFIAFLREDDFKVFREKADSSELKPYLDERIKDFLIRQAYLSLEEKYIRQRMMAKLGIYNPDDIKLMQIVDYIIDRLEENRLERLKKFAEKCKFKTFLSSVVSNLLYDFWRDKYADEKQETKYKDDFKNLFDPPVEDPLNVLIETEEEEKKNRAAKILRRLVEQLDFKDKLALDLKFEQGLKLSEIARTLGEQGLKLSEIARTLGETRYKTEQFINNIMHTLSNEIHKRLALEGPGGNHDTPGR